MTRRLTSLIILALVAAALSPLSAYAYENGGDGGDGYGTHDWVLDHAIDLSGQSWVNESVALLASDDPDKVFGEVDRPNHHFLVSGSRGAPQAVADYYFRAVTAYQAGDYATASYHLGILSHYYADICQPMHTVYDPANDALHIPWEEDLGAAKHRSPTDSADWITPRSRVSVSDVRQLTVDTALAVRETYPSFIAAIRADGGVYRSSNTTVEAITKQNLSRAANGLADMIRSIARGEGVSGPGNLSVSMKSGYVAPGATAVAYATCVDDGGDPIEGAKISFSWQLPSGTVVTSAVTNGDGVAAGQVTVGDEPLGRTVAVTSTSSSGGSSDSATTQFTLSDAVDYIMTTLSNYAPKQGTLLTARTVCLNADGKPIPNLPVTFTWEYKTKTVSVPVVTDEWGIAQSSRNIGAASLDFRVRIRGTAVNPGGTTRSSSKSFVPRVNSAGLSFNPIALSGASRFETAVAISSKAYYATADTVIIANGRNFPDALGGAALAGAYDAPILLSERGSLPGDVADEIRRLGASTAIILGGTGAIQTTVETSLKQMGITRVVRLGGADRYETARKIARETISETGAGWDGTAFVATGRSFPDALASSSLAAARRWPIYLSDPGADPAVLAAQMKSDGVTSVIVVGGTGSVPAACESALKGAIGDVQRIEGDDRYATGLAIARFGVEHAGLMWDAMAISTGENFPDALAGSVFGSTRGAVMVLTPSTRLRSDVAALIGDVREEIGTVHYLGGTSSLSTSVRDAVARLLD